MTKNKNKTNDISSMARNYIQSLVNQEKIFTTQTIINQFPSSSEEMINTIAAEIASTSKKYSVVRNSMVFVPRRMFSENRSKNTTITKSSSMSTHSGVRGNHLTLSSSDVNSLGLSQRKYRYTIDASTLTLTVHRNSTSEKMHTFTVWSNNRSTILVPAAGEWTVKVR